MDYIFEDRNKRQIFDQEELRFTSFSAFHLITVAARTKDKRQVSPDALRYESLAIEIDGKRYSSSFQGNKLHNGLQTIFFVIFLRGRDHTVRLVAGPKQKTATLESLTVSVIDLANTFSLTLHDQAEDGNGRPWIAFVLDTLPLASFTATVTYSRRKRDSDDVKVIIDDATQKNLLKTIKFLFWRLAGSLLPLKNSTKTETETFSVNLPKAIHTIRFEADRTPTFENISFDFGTKPEPPIRLPTADNPKWTEDFADDSEEMLLARAMYGETGGESKETKIGVGWTIKNRVQDPQQRWGKTYHEVILAKDQYDSFWNKDTYDKIRDPKIHNNPIEMAAWQASYEASIMVLTEKINDPTYGSNHFYATTIPKPYWADDQKFTVQIGITRFYKL